LTGDVIESFLGKEIPEFRCAPQATHIVSNFIKYDENERIKAFNDKIIHSFNKNEFELGDSFYYQSIVDRTNVILLGDTLGDVGMISQMHHLKHILKIGYLNRSTPSNLAVYTNIYDIVICNDQTFDVPNMILQSISSRSRDIFQ
jgi:cytosolic 5'-nucleotidase 3